MRLIDRYLLRELLTTLFFAVAVLSLVLVVGNIFKQLMPLLVNRDVPAEYLFRVIAYVMPFSLTFTIPWGVLVAVLLVFGRVSADNEIIALQSNGVSIARICLPLLGVVLGATALCFWLSVEVGPVTREKLSSTIFDLARGNPMALFSSDQVIDEFPGRKIYVGRKQGNKLENIIVFETDEQLMPMIVTHARSGTLETDLPNQGLLLHLHDARYQQRDQADPLDLRKLRDGIRASEGTLSISLAQLYERRRRPGRAELSLKQLMDQLEKNNEQARSADRAELSKRFALPFSCIAFALIGVPLGVTAHRRETSIGFGLSLVVVFSYYVFFIIADTLRDNPSARADLLVWAPNILFIGLGGLMFWRFAQK